MLTLVTNSGGQIIYANLAVSRLLGWAASDLAGKDIGCVIPEAEYKKVQELIASHDILPERDQSAQEIDVWLLRKDQKSKQTKLSWRQLVLDGEYCSCLSMRVASISDIELRIAREQIVEFKEASENKSRFLSNMSHEIRTTLNGVLGMVDLLASSTLDEQQSNYLASLKKSSRNLRALLNDVLDFSKIEAGLIEIETVPFDIQDTLQAVVDAFLPAAAAKGIQLQFRHNLNHRLYEGDPHRLSQVVTNLVSNALKFTREGTVTISVTEEMLMVAQDICKLTLSVTDTGIGMQPEQQGRLFASFQQGSTSVSRKYGGSGLGLFICKQLVELMGGKISVASQAGQGSSFEFWVELQPSYSSSVFMDTAPPEKLESLVGARVLVVDDDLTSQILLEVWLKQCAVVVVCRSNGQEAIDYLTSGEYVDAVLMDVSMPVLDGLSATRQIRQQEALGLGSNRHVTNIPIIGISAHAMEAEVQRCLEAGMTACLNKPLSRVGMLEQLASVLAMAPSE